MDYQVKTFYFSATGNTKKVVTAIAEELSGHTGGKAVQTVDFTLPAGRAKPAVFEKNDLVVAGIPVYAEESPICC